MTRGRMLLQGRRARNGKNLSMAISESSRQVRGAEDCSENHQFYSAPLLSPKPITLCQRVVSFCDYALH